MYCVCLYFLGTNVVVGKAWAGANGIGTCMCVRIFILKCREGFIPVFDFVCVCPGKLIIDIIVMSYL